MTITDRPAAGPLVRCPNCGVLDRAARHICDPANVVRTEVMRRLVTPLTADNARG